ncbi:putative polysaccharide biosynthesis domain-containing protein [Dioscorea sansibarensis]
MKKLISILFLILSTLCFIRLFIITLSTSSAFHEKPQLSPFITTTEEESLSFKEYNLLSNIIARRAPCNLLIFGLNAQLLNLSLINKGGKTVFLEDNADKLKNKTWKANAVHVYKVRYHGNANEAFELLKFAREHNACSSEEAKLHIDSCQLALTELPRKVYREKWDVVVIDGPRGDKAEMPGRMRVIYTVGVLARAGNNATTDVVVHDVNRMIEKWYSWEFLCQENLVSSKGKLWHFQIKGGFGSGSFCHDTISFST